MPLSLWFVLWVLARAWHGFSGRCLCRDLVEGLSVNIPSCSAFVLMCCRASSSCGATHATAVIGLLEQGRGVATEDVNIVVCMKFQR